MVRKRDEKQMGRWMNIIIPLMRSCSFCCQRPISKQAFEARTAVQLTILKLVSKCIFVNLLKKRVLLEKSNQMIKGDKYHSHKCLYPAVRPRHRSSSCHSARKGESPEKLKQEIRHFFLIPRKTSLVCIYFSHDDEGIQRSYHSHLLTSVHLIETTQSHESFHARAQLPKRHSSEC